jgi:hypothetical protein
MSIRSRQDLMAQAEQDALQSNIRNATAHAKAVIERNYRLPVISIEFHSTRAAAVRAVVEYINGSGSWRVSQSTIKDGAYSHYLKVVASNA